MSMKEDLMDGRVMQQNQHGWGQCVCEASVGGVSMGGVHVSGDSVGGALDRSRQCHYCNMV